MMDLRQMRYITVLAEELNFTRAARRLLVAQPALSQQIRSLERKIGGRLVDRGGRGCRLTPLGEVVVQEAGEILERVAAAESRIRAAVSGLEGELRLAYTRSARGGTVDALVSAFRSRYPGITLHLQTGWTSHNEAELLAGRLDAAFIRPPLNVPELRCHDVAYEELLLAVPVGHPLAHTHADSRIGLDAIADEPVLLFPRANGPGMHDLISRQLWPENGPRIVREEPDDEQLLLAVAAGHGIAPVPEGRARALRVPGVRLRHLAGPTPTVPIGLAYHPQKAGRPVELLLALIRELRHRPGP